MKKLKYLLLLLLFIVPFAVWAEEESVDTSSSDSKEVKIYFFRGEGCPHCQEAEEWFQSIENEYGSMFKVVDYETWNDETNAELMQKVAKAREESADGVPYIIIGDKSWNGFDTSYESEMIGAIKEDYEKPISERVDIIAQVNGDQPAKKKDSVAGDIVGLFVILVIIGLAGTGIYFARKNTK